MVFKNDLNVISIIGIVLLIGLVKKNAIMMIDFALVAEREHGKNTTDAIFEACMLRFRPIMMTTMAALFGALPLAFGTGTGSELRRPLGITIVGGLIVSQMLTLYTTPVIYLYMDRLRLRALGRRHDTFTASPRRSSLERALLWRKRQRTNRRSQVGFLLCLMLTGCTVGPKYHPPAIQPPPAFKEAPPASPTANAAQPQPTSPRKTEPKTNETWTVAQPADAKIRGDWWAIFNEPELNDLESQLNINNQNLKLSFENYMQARALVR